MRAGDGGAALGAYSAPGKVRISIDSATSKRWSSVQLTMLADSGVASGQVRQFPVVARLNAALLLAPVLGTGLLSMYPASRPGPVSTAGIAVTSPAISNPPRAASSNPRLVDDACRLRGHRSLPAGSTTPLFS